MIEIKLKQQYIRCSSSGSPFVFKLNKNRAHIEDFGDLEEREDDGGEYGCSSLYFTPKKPTPEILLKYKLSNNEYLEVCNVLEKELEIPNCCQCE